MSERLEDFVRGSQALAGDSGVPAEQLEAAEEAHRLGSDGRSLPAERIAAWAEALDESLTQGEAEAHAAWLRAHLGDAVGRPWLARGRDAAETVEALAAVLERFGPSTRVARWVCAWAAELLGRPLLVFWANDAEALRGGPARLRLLVAGKLRVATYDLSRRRGSWAGGDAAAAHYEADGAEWIVEWHELLDAETRWRAQAGQGAS